MRKGVRHCAAVQWQKQQIYQNYIQIQSSTGSLLLINLETKIMIEGEGAFSDVCPSHPQPRNLIAFILRNTLMKLRLLQSFALPRTVQLSLGYNNLLLLSTVVHIRLLCNISSKQIQVLKIGCSPMSHRLPSLNMRKTPRTRLSSSKLQPLVYSFCPSFYSKSFEM